MLRIICKKILVFSDIFMIFVIVSSKRSIHAFNSTVGNGSSSNVAGIKEESRSIVCAEI